ncbi:hypothetical protein PM082_018512 [Marasmius tenuissimus]|nr:hypothetical protein PM082_018512 [Marasmius tenuissimus]
MSLRVLVDHTNPDIVYTPLDGWSSGTCANPVNGTCHSTRVSGAQVKFTFEGTFIEVFGATNSTPTSANSRARVVYAVDDYTSEDPLPQNLTDGVLLYQPTSPLGLGVHNLTITIAMLPDDRPYMLSYFAISTPYDTTTHQMASASPDSGSSPKVNTWAIIGGSIAAVIVLSAILATILRTRFRRRTQVRHCSDTPDSTNRQSLPKSISEAEESSDSLPLAPPATPTTLTPRPDSNLVTLRSSFLTTASVGSSILGSILSDNSDSTTLPLYSSRAGTPSLVLMGAAPPPPYVAHSGVVHIVE